MEEQTVMFWSNAKYPLHRLSNFATADVFVNGVHYPSSEHAFVATKLFKPEFKYMLETGESLGSRYGFTVAFGSAKAEAKEKYWMKKGNIGIIAKVAQSMKQYTKSHMKDTTEDSFEVWRHILLAKFSDPVLRDILLSTGTKYLLEFDRGATEDTYWAGKMVDGFVIGNNAMGKYLMRVRQLLREQ
jgi:predicted NAD-dependent protein-ADP-ribosyltransferase YbiA (DUF1768 family)